MRIWKALAVSAAFVVVMASAMAWAQDTANTPTVTGEFEFKLAKGSRLVPQEDAWTNLKGERESLPLLELSGTNPFIVMRRVINISVVEVTPAASGAADPEVRATIDQSPDDLMSSFKAMSGPGVTTQFEPPVVVRTNTIAFLADDVIGTEKLPHVYLEGRSLHIVYMREGSPFAPYVIMNIPIDEFRSMIAKLQGRRIISVGWEAVQK